MKKKSFIFLFVFLIAKIIFSQNHYWTNQYGATNTLLGGANTASVRDNAAIYYNPGCMGFIDNPKISISANVYKADFLNLKNVGGDNINAKTTKVLFFPEILGGNFTVKKVPALKIFYGILTRNRESVRFSAKNEMLYDLIPNSPNQEYYKGRLDYNFNSQYDTSTPSTRCACTGFVAAIDSIVTTAPSSRRFKSGQQWK